MDQVFGIDIDYATSATARIALLISFYVTLMYIAIVAVHEAGHIVAAWFVGAPIRSVRIGIGPILGRFVWRKMIVGIRLFPVIGAVQQATVVSKWRQIAISAAGPGANMVSGVIVYAATGGSSVFAVGFAAASVVCGVMSLLPLPSSDGSNIADQLRRTR